MHRFVYIFSLCFIACLVLVLSRSLRLFSYLQFSWSSPRIKSTQRSSWGVRTRDSRVSASDRRLFNVRSLDTWVFECICECDFHVYLSHIIFYLTVATHFTWFGFGLAWTWIWVGVFLHPNDRRRNCIGVFSSYIENEHAEFSFDTNSFSLAASKNETFPKECFLFIFSFCSCIYKPEM